MYTQCPSCDSLFEANAQNLRVAMGMVRCTHCATVFNALASLKDEHEITPTAAEALGVQLPIREFGDAVVIDAGFLAKQEWFRDGLEATRPPVATEQPDALSVPRSTPPPRRPAQEIPKLAPRPPISPYEPDVPGELKAPPRQPSSVNAWTQALLGQTLSLAVRNLSRHRRRTALAMGAIGFGVIALIIAGGFAEWMVWMERESTIHSRLGHIQIVKQGFYEKGVADPYAFLMSDKQLNLEALNAVPHVNAVTPRLNFSGLISKGDTTVSFLGEGVAPSTEAAVSREVIVHAGENLADANPNGIVLGKGLATSLGAKPGDQVVLLTNDGDGKVSALDAEVRGVFHTAVKAFDDVTLRVPITLARRLIRAEGAHQLLILLDDTDRTDEVLATLRQQIPEQKTRLKVTPWIDLAEFYKAVVELFDAQTAFVRTIIAAIIIMSISNTLIMSVMERTSEIGTMMAVGMRGSRIMRLFVSEGFIVGLLGGLLGLVLGLTLAKIISVIGIPMPPAPGMDAGFVASIRVTWKIAASAFAVAVISAVLASLYPAWKASHLEIVDALRRAR
jgi:putative ABC transport system permease protein